MPLTESFPKVLSKTWKWSIPAKSLEILYSLDLSAHFSLALEMIQRMLELAFADALANEGTTEEAVAKEAETM